MNEQELSEYISKMMVELGIEIVREEESELSVLSSTWPRGQSFHDA